MTIENKKIIAREFLIFLSMIMTAVLIIIGLLLYNYSIREDSENIETVIIQKKDLLKTQEESSANNKIEQQKNFFKKIEQNFDLEGTEYKNYKVVWKALQKVANNDSIQYKWNNDWSLGAINFYKRIGYNNPQELENFILKNSLKPNEEINYQDFISEKKEIEKLKSQRKELEYKLFDIEDSDFLASLSIILIITFFLLRYLFYAIKWSIRMLRA